MDCLFDLAADESCEETDFRILLFLLFAGIFSAGARGCQGGMNRIGRRYRLTGVRCEATPGRFWGETAAKCGDPQAYIRNRCGDAN